MSALNIHMSHYSMAFVRWYLSHDVTTSRKFDKTSGWYLAIPSCLVVSLFKGVTPGCAFEQSIRGRPAIFPGSARQWYLLTMWRSTRSDSVIWSIGCTSTRFAACIVAECTRRWRSRNGSGRADFVKVGSVSAMAPFRTMSRIFGKCYPRRGLL